MKNNINWPRAIVAGVLGTLAFDLVGFAFTGQWWDIASLLGEKTGLGFAYGLAGHYGNGILLAILYAGIAPSLWGPAWLRAITFTTIETIALVWFFMFPLLGAGIGGTEIAPVIPFVSLLRHWAFAIPLIFIIHQTEAVPFAKSKIA
jgi:hypothetical protein